MTIIFTIRIRTEVILEEQNGGEEKNRKIEKSI